MREDTFTNTVEDAAAYERLRGRDEWIGDDRPSRGELAAEAAEDRQREELDRRRRERGEFVAEAATAYAGSTLAIRLGRHGLWGISVVPVREHVYRVDGVKSLEHGAWKLIGSEYEAKVHDGTVWVKWTDPIPAEPPF